MKNCITCGSRDIRFLIQRIDQYSYRYCNDCRLVLADPMPSQEELADYYDGFMGGGVDETSSFGFKLQSRKAVAKNFIDWLKKVDSTFKPEGARLADIGGGAGFFSEGFRCLGLKPTLIDIDPQACKFARDSFHNNFETLNADPVEANLPSEFEVVFMNQIIEHYVNPNALIQKAMSWLKPGGFLILTTPNQMSKFFWFSVYFFYNYLRKTSQKKIPLNSFFRFLQIPWICCDPPRHVYSFNPNNIKYLLEKNGLTVVHTLTEMNGFNRFLGKTKYNWTMKSPRNFISIFGNLFELLGSNLIHRLNPKKTWGHHIITLARKP